MLKKMTQARSPEIGVRIHKLRKGRKLTQKEFAERLGVDPSYISKIERDAATPSRQLIKAICKEFGVQEVWILEGVSALGQVGGISADEIEPWEIHRKEFSALPLRNQFSVLERMLLVIFFKVRDLIFAKDALELPDESVLADKEKLINLLDQIKGGLSYLFKSLELEKARRDHSLEGDS